MKPAIRFFVFALWCSLTTSAQILPTESGGCSISPTVEGCDFLSGAAKSNVDASLGKQSVPDDRREFTVTRFTLSAGASMTRMFAGDDQFIVGMGKGELTNEAKSPPVDVSVYEGSVFLMPKDEPYKLRNVGKQSVEVLVIYLNPTKSASQ